MKYIGVYLFLFLIYILFSECSRDFYSILDIPRSANKNQVKKAYRNLAKKLHPDKNQQDPNADKKFRDLNEAYEVLSDDEKREIYDKHGEQGLKERNQNFGGGGFDPFSSFFGHDFFGFGHSQRGGQQETPKGGDVTIDLWVTLEELYNGNFVEVVRRKSVKKEAAGKRQCNCRSEMRTIQLGPGRFQMSQEQVCDSCPNIRFVPEEKLLEIEIEQGMVDGHIYTFPGEGEPHIDGDNGDLKFAIRQLHHPIFNRKGDDLYTNVSISLVSALNGFTLDITHLDNRIVTIKREKITWPGAVMKKLNEGMPRYDNNLIKGTLFITFDVVFPQGRGLTEEEQDIVSKLFSSNTDQNSKVYNGLDPIST